MDSVGNSKERLVGLQPFYNLKRVVDMEDRRVKRVKREGEKRAHTYRYWHRTISYLT